jgi:hypothetical protein
MRARSKAVGLTIVVLGLAIASVLPATAVGATVSQTDAAGTVWLCRPGLAHNPCGEPLASTVVDAQGHRTVVPIAAGRQKYDCFYLYPTSSSETGTNSDLVPHAGEQGNALAQAAQFSHVCNVFAPMYKSVTVDTIMKDGAGGAAGAVAFASVEKAWQDYISHYNGGRPIIFISHSQGSVMMIELLRKYVDPSATLRDRTVSAIIAGGGVEVPAGKTVGGTFQSLPLCTSATTVHCVIAYSTFPSTPPAGSQFGRPGVGIAPQSGQTTVAGEQVACVNPARLSGGTAQLLPDFPIAAPFPMSNMAPTPALSTAWVTYPALYTAGCKSGSGATWLQVTSIRKSGDTRPLVTQPLGVSWGFHFEDINLPLADLVNDVHNEEAAYSK